MAMITRASRAATAKNIIINGNFDVWQRGTSFTAIGNQAYGPDRFFWGQAGAGIVDWLRSTSVPDGTSAFSLQVDVTTADITIAAGDFYVVGYRVEGFEVQRFGFGSADAQRLTLNFWVRSPLTGIHCVAFRNNAVDRSFVAEYTIDAINTWERKTITLTADTAGVWLSDNGIGLRINWALAVGTTFQTAAGSWAAGDFLATSNQVNVMDNVANNFQIARVQVELGSIALAFERRSIGQEMALCQRYYAKTFLLGTTPAQNAGVPGSLSVGAASDGKFAFHWQFSVLMRTITPTFTTYNPSFASAGARNVTDNTNTPVLVQAAGDRAVTFRQDPTDATDADDRMQLHVAADAEL